MRARALAGPARRLAAAAAAGEPFLLASGTSTAAAAAGGTTPPALLLSLAGRGICSSSSRSFASVPAAAAPAAAALAAGAGRLVQQPWAAAGFATATANHSGHSVAQQVLAAPQGSVGADVTAALQSLEPAGVPSVARAAAVTGIHDAAFLEALAQAAVRAMPQLSAADICSVVESFSDLDCYSIEFKDATATLVLDRLGEFSGDMLGHLLRAFGDMSYYDDELLEGVVSNVAAHPDKFSAENIADVVYAFSRCGFCHPDLITVVETAAGTLLKEAAADRGYAIANILDAYSRVGCSSPEVVDQLIAKAAESPGSFDAGCLAKVTTAVIKLGYSDERLLAPLLDCTVDKLAELSPKAVVELLGALGDLGYKHQGVLDAVTDKVVPGRIHEFTLDCLADMVENLNKLGYYNREFMALLKQTTDERKGRQPATA